MSRAEFLDNLLKQSGKENAEMRMVNNAVLDIDKDIEKALDVFDKDNYELDELDDR